MSKLLLYHISVEKIYYIFYSYQHQNNYSYCTKILNRYAENQDETGCLLATNSRTLDICRNETMQNFSRRTQKSIQYLTFFSSLDMNATKRSIPLCSAIPDMHSFLQSKYTFSSLLNGKSKKIRAFGLSNE